MALTARFYLGPAGDMCVAIEGEGVKEEVFSEREILPLLERLQSRLEACYGPDEMENITNLRRDFFTSRQRDEEKLQRVSGEMKLQVSQEVLDKLISTSAIESPWASSDSNPVSDIERWSAKIKEGWI